MRKAAAVIVAMMILLSSASAEIDLDHWVKNHNLYCSTTSAAEITGEPKQDTDAKGNPRYTFSISDNLQVIFTTDGDKVIGCSCVCLSESDVSEFLAQCINICYNFGGIYSGIECYDPILYQFIQARNGVETETVMNVPEIIFNLSKAKFGYFFILVLKEP